MNRPLPHPAKAGARNSSGAFALHARLVKAAAWPKLLSVAAEPHCPPLPRQIGRGGPPEMCGADFGGDLE